MIRIIAVAVSGFVLCSLLACGGDAPKLSHEAPGAYAITSAVVDQSKNDVTFAITISPQATEADARAAVEKIVAENKASYSSITVKTFFRGTEQGGLPYGWSTFTDGVTSHAFNPRAASQKIPTH